MEVRERHVSVSQSVKRASSLYVYSSGLHTITLPSPPCFGAASMASVVRDLNPWLGIGSKESSLQREDFYTEIYNLIQENAFISVQNIFCTYVM